MQALASQTYPLLFAPGQIGPREARNRIVSTSHGTNMSDPDGSPSDAEIAYHAAKAAGGCGIVQMFGTASATPIGVAPSLWGTRPALPNTRP